MEASLVPVWITSTASVIGVIYAIVRNGSRRKKMDENLKTELKAEMKNTQKQLDDPDMGLNAIKKSIDGMRLHCAEVSTRIEAQVITSADEIEKLRQKRQRE